ncbi:MAG: hypothetical protein K0R67_2108 [Paenibacillus sp.]|jgi:AraC family transcriptional regulator of arabinose operon|nr:hypothetical protein [Paenibacillus sp.]
MGGMNKMTDFLNDSAMSSSDDNQITVTPTPGVLIADHFKESYEYKANRPAGTRDYLITFTLGGCGCYRIDNQSRLCKRGDVMLLTPGTPHHYATSEQSDGLWDFVWCHFLPPTDWQPFLALPETLPGLIHVPIVNEVYFARLLHAFHRIIQDQLHGDLLHERLAYLALEEIVLLLAHQSGKEQQGSTAVDPRVEEVRRLLLLNMQDQHTIPLLAERVRLSPSRLAHLFKEQTGYSIMEMLLRIRLRHGARQLQYTSRPISEVAEDVGFQSPFYFTKQFTAAYGMSPSAYRKEAQAQVHGQDLDLIPRS